MIEEREAKKNGTVIEKDSTEAKEIEDVKEKTETLSPEEKRKQAEEEKARKAEERKKALEERRKKILEEREAAKKERENKTND